MAKVFDFLLATNEVLKENGVEFPLPAQSTPTPESRAEKGLAMQKQIIGDSVSTANRSTFNNLWSINSPRTVSEGH